jgi:hypothetical protein
MHRLRSFAFAKALDGDPQPMEVDLTAEARQAWAAWVNAHGVTTAQLAGAAAALSAKIEGAAARLALLHWACRYVEGEAGERIDAEAIEAGVGLARWFLTEGLRIYQLLGIDSASADQAAGELVKWIAEHCPGGCSIRVLYSAGPRQLRNNPDEAEAALNALAADGYGRWEVVPPPSGRGPATRVFVLSKEWLAAFRPDAEEEVPAAGPDVEAAADCGAVGPEAEAEAEATWEAQAEPQPAEEPGEPQPAETDGEPDWADEANQKLAEASADGAEWAEVWEVEGPDDATRS